jgi:hypothetical protein
MEQFIQPDRIANAIMQDNSFNGYYLIVEGNKDVKFYQKYIDKTTTRIREAFGSEKVKLVLKILNERGYSRRIGIIDSDFNAILNLNEQINGLYITDDHDVEIMIIKTKALEDVIYHYCSKSKIGDFEKKKGKTIREILFELGKEVGYLKLANKVHELGLIFKPSTSEGNQIKYKDFIDEDTLNFLGSDKMINSIMNYSRSKSSIMKGKELIKETLNEIKKVDYDRHHLVNGHDVTNILYLLMKKTFGSKNKMLNDHNAVEDSLILAYDYVDFKQTNLYKDLEEWATQNGQKLFS